MNTQYRFIDLFAGIGGFRLALENLGQKCVFSSEWDKHAQRTYTENFGETPAGDITKIDAKDIPTFDILCAGFPCQSFSISGKQGGFADTRGTLFFDIVRIAKHHQPQVLFLENVKNFASHDQGKTLATVLTALEEIGYQTYYQILNASHFGLPTARERIYLVSFRQDLQINNFSFPLPTGQSTKLLDFLEPDNTDTQACQIIRPDIFIKPATTEPNTFGHFPQKPIRIGHINGGGQGERIYSPLGQAITLSAYGGGAASKTGAYLINNQVRKLTPRECARIMGFPDDFKILVTPSQAYKQFGNSVAIAVVEAIFEKIYTTLNQQNLWQPRQNTHPALALRSPEMVF